MQNRFKTVIKKCNIEDANFHVLRHIYFKEPVLENVLIIQKYNYNIVYQKIILLI